ncbi:MAG: division/cell wall cluster transcriptional repressor MraZ [Armatimonadetes bacterium]|nr:division/cell wall cluster transcriptional repressor MraZ [Armatimonadota bacterium]
MRRPVFIGGYFHTLDDKGRVVIPPRFRNLLGERFIITKGLHGCLWVLKEDRWAVIQQRLQSESMRKEQVILQRFLSGGAAECSPDSQGRVLIPPVLRDFARIERDVVSIGAVNRVEIWGRERWDEYNAALDDESIEASLERVDLL